MSKDRDCKGFITGFGSSAPSYRVSQEQIGAFMKSQMVLDEKMKRWIDLLVKRSGIAYRHSVIPDYGAEPGSFQFYPDNQSLRPFPATGERMRYYKLRAMPLAAEAALRCLENAGTGAAKVTHLVVVSCTGMYAPGLDIDLVGRLGLPSSTARTCINFMGCYAAFNALKLASSIVESNRSAHVLIVCVELCSLHFQKDGRNSNHVLTNMLFGDGASAALVTGERIAGAPALSLLNFACDLFPEGKEDMTWEVGDSGFAMKLTRRVPEILKKRVPELFDRLLTEAGRHWQPISHYAFHPGGPRVLHALEEACGITAADNRLAYKILREYGNMSSATLFFILEQVLSQRTFSEGDLLLTAAFGPGLTCETALMSCLAE